jgi:hypothetical protein
VEPEDVQHIAGTRVAAESRSAESGFGELTTQEDTHDGRAAVPQLSSAKVSVATAPSDVADQLPPQGPIRPQDVQVSRGAGSAAGAGDQAGARETTAEAGGVHATQAAGMPMLGHQDAALPPR